MSFQDKLPHLARQFDLMAKGCRSIGLESLEGDYDSLRQDANKGTIEAEPIVEAIDYDYRNGQDGRKAAELLVGALLKDALFDFLAERQRIVIDWGAKCFGADHMADPIVRGARFFEEAAELAQSVGLPRDHAMRAFNHVYSREPGEPAQEVGGVANTLMALCGAIGLSMDDCQKAEIARCLAKSPEHFAERNKAKLREVDADTGGTPAWRYAAGSCEPLSLESFREIIGTRPNPAAVIWAMVAAYIEETEDLIIDAEFKATERDRSVFIAELTKQRDDFADRCAALEAAEALRSHPQAPASGGVDHTTHLWDVSDEYRKGHREGRKVERETLSQPWAFNRDSLGRLVRRAWVRWAQTQEAPKPSWLLPYDELAEPDKEADRQIGEAIVEFMTANVRALSPSQPASGEVPNPVAWEWRNKQPTFPPRDDPWSYVDYATGLLIKHHPEKYEVRALYAAPIASGEGKLREALAPFAKRADDHSPNARDDTTVHFRLRHCRAAREALGIETSPRSTPRHAPLAEGQEGDAREVGAISEKVLGAILDWQAPYEVRRATGLRPATASDCLVYLKLTGLAEYHEGNNTFRITDEGRKALAAYRALGSEGKP